MTLASLKPAARQALWLLGLDALGAVALGVFVVAYHRTDSSWLNAGDALAGAALQGVWIVLLAGLFRGEEADGWNGWFVAYRSLFPLLLAWRGLLFLLILAGTFSNPGGAGTVSWLLLFVAWGGSLLAEVAIYVFSLRLFAEPGSPAARLQLRRWLEWAAILGAAMTVMNVYPPSSLPRPDPLEMIVWGVTGALDVAALLVLRRALAQLPDVQAR